MAFTPIPNSNAATTPFPGRLWQRDDFTPAGWAAISTDVAPDEQEVHQTFVFQRRSFAAGEEPKGYLTPKRFARLNYPRQQAYVAELLATPGRLEAWYGADPQDLERLQRLFSDHGIDTVYSNAAERILTIRTTAARYREVLLGHAPEAVVNTFDSWFNPADPALSFLSLPGEQAAAVEPLLGAVVLQLGSAADATGSSDGADGGADDLQSLHDPQVLYPRELAAMYGLPNQKRPGAGVHIGLVSGVVDADALNQDNRLNRFLRRQGVKVRQLGTVREIGQSPSLWDGPGGEFGLDLSVLRSVAPAADLTIAGPLDHLSGLYGTYAALIYDPTIDLISSSYGNAALSAFEQPVFEELMLDAALRGITVAIAAGDQGTANTENNPGELWLTPQAQALPLYSQAPAFALSVGGTALSQRAMRALPAARQLDENWQSEGLPRPLGRSARRRLRRQVERQLSWNDQLWQPLDSIADQPLQLDRTVADFPGFDDRLIRENGNQLYGYWLGNLLGSSGVLSGEASPVPAYQRRNLPRRLRSSGRRYPDVALLAGGNSGWNRRGEQSNSFYLVTEPGEAEGSVQWGASGGTSAATPLTTAMLAVVTAELRRRSGKDVRLGAVNPLLYELYGGRHGRRRDAVFIDVPAGSTNANQFGLADDPADWSGMLGVTDVDPITGVISAVPLQSNGPGGGLDWNRDATARGFDAVSGLGSLDPGGLLDAVQPWIAAPWPELLGVDPLA